MEAGKLKRVFLFSIALAWGGQVAWAGEGAAFGMERLDVSTFTGAVSTSIPLEVPPGLAGMQPQLTLQYNSQGGNGWVGRGWMLDMGQVNRSLEEGIPTCDDAVDTFQFNGDDLIEDTSTGYYHTRKENFFKIEKLSSPANRSGTYWLLTTKSGAKMRFGYNADSEVYLEDENGGCAFNWMLDQVKDIHQNSLEIEYDDTSDPGTAYLHRIIYTYHSGAPAGPLRIIEFSTEARPDPRESYRTGFYQSFSRRLNEIVEYIDYDGDEAQGSGELVRQYRFNYHDIYDITDPEDPDGEKKLFRSQLEYVDLIGADDSATSFPHSNFNYSQIGEVWRSSSTWLGSIPVSFAESEDSRLLDSGARFVDFNSDGLQDVVWHRSGDRFISVAYANRGDGQWEDVSSDWKLPESVVEWDLNHSGEDRWDLVFDQGLRFVDYDRDGDVDFIRSNNYGTVFYENNGEKWVPDSRGWHLPEGVYLTRIDNGGTTAGSYETGVRFVDLNGDGWVDIVRGFGSDMKDMRAWIHTKDPSTGWVEDSRYAPPATFTAWHEEGGGRASVDIGLRFAELNGDGLIDLVQSYDGVWGESHRVWLNHPRGNSQVWEETERWKVNFPFSHIVGHDDSPDTSEDQGIQFLDLNGDGLDDFVIAKGGKLPEVWWNTGEGWEKEPSDDWNFPQYVTGADHRSEYLQIVDINGDGAVDLIKKNDGSGSVYLGPPFVGLLERIDTGYGGSHWVEWGATGDYTVESPDILPYPVSIATKLWKSDGNGNAYWVSYAYEKGAWDPQEREFRGFGRVELLDATGTITRQWYHQDLVLKGKLERQEIVGWDGVTYQRQEYGWEPQTVFTDDDDGETRSVYYPLIRWEKTTTFDSDESNFRTKRLDYDYDGWGNRTWERTAEELSDGSLENEKCSGVEYVHNDDLWIHSTPWHTWTDDCHGAVLEESWVAYDGQNWGVAPTKGEITKREFCAVQEKLGNGCLGNVANPQTQLEYDEYGNVTRMTDPNGHSTITTYVLGKPVEDSDSDPTYPSQICNALGQCKTTVYDLRFGVILTETDANGNSSELEYDALGRQVRAYLHPAGQSRILLREILYHDDLYSVTDQQHIETRTYTDGSAYLWSKSYFDGLHRNYKKEELSVDGETVVGVTNFDPATGRSEDSSFRYFKGHEDDIKRVQFEYDPMGRVVTVTRPDGASRTTEYQDWTTTKYDELGNKKWTILDAYGRTVQVTEYNTYDTEYSGGRTEYPTYYYYDKLGNLTSTVDPEGNTTTITYDPLKRKTGIDDPDMGHWSYEYDLVGNLVKQTDARGNVVTFCYDALNRVELKQYNHDVGCGEGAYDPETDVLYEYDGDCDGQYETSESCGEVLYNPIGKLTHVVDRDGRGESLFKYDAFGNLIESKRVVDGSVYIFQTDYDYQGRPTEQRFPDQEKLTLEYDGPNLNSVHSSDLSYLTNVDYNALGQITRIDYGNETYTRYFYDPDTTFIDAMGTYGPDEKLQEYDYTFDAVGNVTDIVDLKFSEKSQSFTYDDLYRLKTATGAYGSLSYAYDPTGNLRLKEGVAFTYGEGAGPHAVTSTSDGRVFQYDENGNMLVAMTRPWSTTKITR